MATSPEISIGAVPAKDLHSVVTGTGFRAKRKVRISAIHPQDVFLA
jgi:hypothetical protein